MAAGASVVAVPGRELLGSGSTILFSANSRRSLGRRRRPGCVVQCLAKQEQGDSPKLITFLGKGGVGKTTCAVLAAQYYASIGLRTCLVVQSQDVTADFLLGHQLQRSPTVLNDGALTAFRVEATKLLSEPLEQVKKADVRINFSQGALQEVASEELSVLPGMDSIMALFVLEQLCGLTRRRKASKSKYEIVVYDGPNSDETLRIFGSAERLRWYMNRFRGIAEKTDLGRVTLPSILRLIEAAVDDGSTERSTSELWEEANAVLQGVERSFADPKRFGSYIVTDFENKLANKVALRYWGCAMQAGVHVAGVLHQAGAADLWKNSYAPLTVAPIPSLNFETPPNWNEVVPSLSQATCDLLQGKSSASGSTQGPVSLDVDAHTVTCFLPGFDKSEVKLSQPKRSELLLTAGDQRRVIKLPEQMYGKVKGAKFQDKSLIVQLNVL